MRRENLSIGTCLFRMFAVLYRRDLSTQRAKTFVDLSKEEIRELEA